MFCEEEQSAALEKPDQGTYSICFLLFPESNPVRSALGIGIYGFIDSLNYHGLSLSAVDRENYWGSRLCMPLSLSLHLAWTSVRAREHMEEVGIGNDVTL